MERDSAAALIEGAQNLDLSQIVRSPFSLESDIQVNATGDPRDPVLLKVQILAAASTLGTGATQSSEDIRPKAQAYELNVTKAPLRWQLAPIRYWGDLAYDFRQTSVEGQSTFTRHSAIVNLNASTYIYEPWIAIVTAGLGLTASRLNDGELAGGDKFATGYARLNLFPMSRFPFEARYLRSDTGIDSDVGADQSHRLTRYGLSQRYRTEDGASQYSASFDRFTQDGTTVGKDIQNALQLDANTRFRRHHDVQLLGTWNHNQRVNTSERNDYETFLARHAFRPDSTFSLESSANLTHTASRFALAESELRILQLNSIAFWRPENKPITVNGGLRLFSLENGAGQNSIETTVVNASAGVNYMASRNLRAVGGVSITDTNVAGQHNRPASGTLGVTYQGDTIELSKYRYDWFVGGTGIYTSGSPDRNGFSFIGMSGQSLSRAFVLGAGGAITFNAAQNLSANTGAQVEAYKQILHSGSITWNNFEPESNSSSFIRLSATDSRFLDGQRETFQLLNLQLTRTLEVGRDHALSGHLTIQSVRNRSERPGYDTSSNDGKRATTASAELNYRHQNLFGVPRLVFSSQLRLNRKETVQDLGAPGDRELRSWENRLDYNIGRLETRLLMRIAEVDQTQYWLVMLRAIRRF